MNLSGSNDLFHQLTTVLDNAHPDDWNDIVLLLNQIKKKKKPLLAARDEAPLKFFAKGTAFITFSYGIDGVSVEISKYAHTLIDLFTPVENPSIYFIGGDFMPEVSSILKPEWHRLQIDGIDGWNKWDEGKWFNALFQKRMKSNSEESNLLTKEIFAQAVSIAKRLGKILHR